ncbi:peptidyl-prolyl cis-trans isomerase family 1 [Toxoplasma gondii TgCatPRC2]|uniref:Peptidyl-prolyl cis-trans isomerase n=15 Tax=Toxoplasma gondii TaxID=5811 RepID=B9PHW7_TOXGV|nr:peptidyl-prolyl cis-trans isomerase family 1 [Toxoplasma gondii ME49]EPR64763.1 peptidyl-prolyl cis-trans isomerase family 1 [Toxoplasma gondii GT1]ESS36237.1 peptidyl-prolyl cis-trans isomerase family 1 [Toxoplasma gondii VEG]KAF4642276.1 peptidyl-prolyl cis-trans isomerase family 1 [Toxoplasma gondii]KFG43668.1 peptidyl-prolyl cis-trans isomerase family 1 [Toxoplasma gondii GAB2-2007-GAL-DOM2]KFG52157.1 peptidyl-prolyl cis-trans isomerase family 1 [Toxoplasma gondii p89]KFG54379.1 peptid|eukprot:XP_002365722.1 peptidyl-prolyl cis-trans isomerase family 1 [Toxoplasma gondii ME49]
MFSLASAPASRKAVSSPSLQASLPSAASEGAGVYRGDETVTLVTSMGDVEVELYWKHAPKTCRNFFELAKSGYYDNTVFHRVAKDFCIQGGDPTGTGRGGESIFGGKFEDEIHPDLRHTGAGVVSMANCGPDTNGSQFFICLAPAPFLDGKHSIFGRVKKGMETVKKISTVQTTATDRPIYDIKIIRAVTATSLD